MGVSNNVLKATTGNPRLC